ncbi:MAG: N-acetyltransferase family protein [Pseudomonadota bacterium]
MEIRWLEAGDLEAVAAIWNPVIRDTMATFTDVEKTPEALAGWLAEGGPRLAAVAEGRLIGFASAGPFRAGPGYRFAWEHTLHVAPEARGRGAGRALIEALCDDLRGRGGHCVIGGVSGENAGALAFHARAGFAEAARIPEVGFKFGRFLDLVLVQRML